MKILILLLLFIPTLVFANSIECKYAEVPAPIIIKSTKCRESGTEYCRATIVCSNKTHNVVCDKEGALGCPARATDCLNDINIEETRAQEIPTNSLSLTAELKDNEPSVRVGLTISSNNSQTTAPPVPTSTPIIQPQSIKGTYTTIFDDNEITMDDILDVDSAWKQNKCTAIAADKMKDLLFKFTAQAFYESVKSK